MTDNMLCKLKSAKTTHDCIPTCAPVGVGEWIVAQTVMPVLASLFTIIITCTTGMFNWSTRQHANSGANLGYLAHLIACVGIQA